MWGVGLPCWLPYNFSLAQLWEWGREHDFKKRNTLVIGIFLILFYFIFSLKQACLESKCQYLLSSAEVKTALWVC